MGNNFSSGSLTSSDQSSDNNLDCGESSISPYRKAYDLIYNPVKSVAAADSFRLEGNEFYKQRRFHDALIDYNKSLCFAPPRSKELGLAYANRSSIYFEVRMYQKSVENIKLARENNYPKEKMKTLSEREEKCLMLIKSGHRDEEFNVWDFFKLSYKANKKVPFIIEDLKLAENEKYGRMILTTRDLKAGDIIAIEEPAFKLLSESSLQNRCSYCLKNNHYHLIPCEKCPKVMYCSNACKDKDLLHSDYCMQRRPRMTDVMISGASRIMKSELAAFHSINEREKKTVFDFDLSNPEAADYEESILKIVNSLSKGDSFEFPCDEPVIKLFVHFNGILSRNAFELGEFAHDRQLEASIGVGLCAFGSLFNHSCYPNVDHVMVEGKLVFVVSRPIKAGEQLFVSYGVHFTTEDSAFREAHLQRYGFQCDCLACVNNFPLTRGLPRCDRKFVFTEISTDVRKAIAQFKKNCRYINQNWDLPLSFELAYLDLQNHNLLNIIARRALNGFDAELADSNVTTKF